MFVMLLNSIVSVSNHTKCLSLSNQNFMTQLALINLHPNEYSQELYYYPFPVNVDSCAGNNNSLCDLLILLMMCSR